MGLVHRAGSGGEFNTFRRGKKHRKGLKVNFFPHPGSSGAKGASRGYQLGSAAGRKATRGWGAQGASVGSSAPQQPPRKRHEIAETQREGPKPLAGGSGTARKMKSWCTPCCQRAPSITSKVWPRCAWCCAYLTEAQLVPRVLCTLPTFLPCRQSAQPQGSPVEPSWLHGCEMRPRLSCSCPVLMSLM